jgi:hypothetical protein
VALFGRKINNAENQLAFIRFLRLIADGEITAEEAVQAYHAVLQKLGIKPQRTLQDDMVLQTNVMSYGGSGTTVSVPSPHPGPLSKGRGEPEVSCACKNGKPSTTSKTGACGCASNGQAKAAESSAAPAAASNDEPDFAKMTRAEKIAYHRARWNRILG